MRSPQIRALLRATKAEVDYCIDHVPCILRKHIANNIIIKDITSKLVIIMIFDLRGISIIVTKP